MIAHRYVPVLCLLLAIALVPTLIHSYSGSVAVDGRRTTAIATTLAGYTSTPTTRAATWGKRRFDSNDWMERHYTNGGNTVRLTVVRSYDPKSLYHHPELAISYGEEFSGEEITRLSNRPEIPVHMLVPAGHEETAAAYVLHYGDRFVDNPIVFQIQTAGELLVSRRRPMTIFFAIANNADRAALTEVLVAAIDDFLAQKPGEVEPQTREGAHSINPGSASPR
jgi:hypothetical protein